MARNPGTTKSGGSFDEATIEAVWRKAPRNPEQPLSVKTCVVPQCSEASTAKPSNGAGKSITSNRCPKVAPMI